MSTLSHVNNCLHSGSISTVIDYHLTSGWTGSDHPTRGLNVEETHNRKHGECRLISRAVTDSCNSEFSVMTSGNIQEHGALCFLLRSVVCQVG